MESAILLGCMEPVVWTDERFDDLSRWMREDIARLDRDIQELRQEFRQKLRERISYVQPKREESFPSLTPLRWLGNAAIALAVITWVLVLFVFNPPS